MDITKNLEMEEEELVAEGWDDEEDDDADYIVYPFLENSPAVCMAYGAPATGKTFAILDMAFAIASGQSEWQGYEIDERRKVLYLTKEGEKGVIRRKKAWLKSHGFEKDCLKGYYFTGREKGITDFRLRNVDDVIRLAKNIKAKMKDVGLIILDTFSLFFGGSNENDNTEVEHFLGLCNSLAKEVQCRVFVIHHTRKDGESYRGATTFEGNTNLMLLFGKNENNRFIYVQKNKDGEDGYYLLKFNLKTVTVGQDRKGRPKKSCVIDKLSKEEENDIEKKEKNNKDLELLIDYIKCGMLEPHAIEKEERGGGIRLLYVLRKEEWADILKSEEGLSQNLANKETNPREEGRRAFRLCRDKHLFPVRDDKGRYKYFILGIPLDDGVWEIPNHRKKRPFNQEFVTSKGESFSYMFSTDDKFVDVTEEIKKLGIDLKKALEETKDFEATNKESIISKELQDKEPIDGELFNN